MRVSEHVPSHAIQLILTMGHKEMDTVRQQADKAYGTEIWSLFNLHRPCVTLLQCPTCTFQLTQHCVLFIPTEMCHTSAMSYMHVPAHPPLYFSYTNRTTSKLLQDICLV